jgi:hypothetical protein
LNLNDSMDEATNDYSSYWQSIPDPPTPGKAVPEIVTDDSNLAAERRRKRRESALKDLTNKKPAVDVDRNNFKGRRAGNETSDESSDEFASLFSELQDDEDELNRCKKRSSKKRRSLLLPSDGGVDLLADDSLANKNRVLSQNVVNSTESDKDTGTIGSIIDTRQNNNSTSTNEEIVNLVRKYCSLPLDQRLNSDESALIESITTYPMPGKTLSIFNSDNESCKREFILRAKPIVILMEEQKQKDIDDARNYTGCEVKRVKGGLVVEYVDLETGDLVHGEEYRRRYCNMLQDVKAQRLLKLEVDGTDNIGAEKSLNETSPFADDSNMDMDESVFSPDDSLVHVDDGLVLSSAKASSDARLIISSSSDTPKIPPVAKEQEGADRNSDAKTAHSKPHPLIGSLPPSDDPRVLEARRKLFHAIDTALASYSREILALAPDDGAQSCAK